MLIGAVDQARRFIADGYRRQVQMMESDRMTTIVADIPSLKHAFAEVIGNALKFSDHDNPVVLSQWIEDDVLLIQIEDHGVGIPAEQLDQVFDAFMQVNRETHEQQGVGLGLWLASNIIQLHHGKLDINSTLNEGTRVLIQLPL